MTKEPIVCESSFADLSSVTLFADLRIHGVWQPQVDFLFDVHVTDVDAPSYRSRSSQAVLCSAEVEKQCKYMEACLASHASFTPLCFSTDGMFGTEADFFLRCLAEQLSTKWERLYSEVIGWVRSRLSFAILWATMLCVQGLRSRWRSLGIVDGACISESD